MRIVVTGQADIGQLADLLDTDGDIPAGDGGIPPVHEVRSLIERGHEVVLVTLDSTITDEIVLRGERLTVHVGPSRPRHGVRSLYREERAWLAATIRSLDPDVVHAHWTYEYALGALESGCPVVVTIHDAPLRIVRWNLPQHGTGRLPKRLATTAHWMLRAYMARRVARRSRFNIAVSPHTRNHFERVLGCRGEIVVIPNSMNPSLWRSDLTTARAADRPDDEPFRCAAVLGTWSDLKNGETLLEAFALVRASVPDARLLLVGGDFGADGEAASWARRRGLADGVDFVGRLANDDVAGLLGSVDLVVHPSREEACGMVIAEAQLASTAVIGGASSGGVPWTLGYGVAGALVDIGSAEQIAGAILALHDDPSHMLRLAQSGRALAARRYDPAAITVRIEETLRRCIDASGTSSAGPRR